MLPRKNTRYTPVSPYFRDIASCFFHARSRKEKYICLVDYYYYTTTSLSHLFICTQAVCFHATRLLGRSSWPLCQIACYDRLSTLRVCALTLHHHTCVEREGGRRCIRLRCAVLLVPSSHTAVHAFWPATCL